MRYYMFFKKNLPICFIACLANFAAFAMDPAELPDETAVRNIYNKPNYYVDGDYSRAYNEKLIARDALAKLGKNENITSELEGSFGIVYLTNHYAIKSSRSEDLRGEANKLLTLKGYLRTKPSDGLNLCLPKVVFMYNCIEAKKVATYQIQVMPRVEKAGDLFTEIFYAAKHELFSENATRNIRDFGIALGKFQNHYIYDFQDTGKICTASFFDLHTGNIMMSKKRLGDKPAEFTLVDCGMVDLYNGRPTTDPYYFVMKTALFIYNSNYGNDIKATNMWNIMQNFYCGFFFQIAPKYLLKLQADFMLNMRALAEGELRRVGLLQIALPNAVEGKEFYDFLLPIQTNIVNMTIKSILIPPSVPQKKNDNNGHKHF